jgi:hypothetical protein
MIRLGIRQGVQRLFDRGSHHLVPCVRMRSSPIWTTGPCDAFVPSASPTTASMVGSIALASEVSRLLLVPTSKHKTRINCAKMAYVSDRRHSTESIRASYLTPLSEAITSSLFERPSKRSRKNLTRHFCGDIIICNVIERHFVRG